MRSFIIIAILLLLGSAQAATLTVCPSRCDYKSIQAAVYAAKTNDTIELRSGTYNESVLLTKELKFVGKNTGTGEPIVTGDLYPSGFRYSLRGFGFKSVKAVLSTYSANPDSAYYWIAKSREYENAQSYTKAFEAASKAVEIDPQNILAVNAQGNSLYDQSRYEEALEYYDKALQIDNSSSTLWGNKGAAFSNLMEYEKALDCYDQAIKADPRDSSYWIKKAYIFEKQSKYDDALEASNKAIELSPQYAINWQAKGAALYAMARYDEALTAINKAISLAPSDANLWQLKGLILQATGSEEANDAFAKARELGYTG